MRQSLCAEPDTETVLSPTLVERGELILRHGLLVDHLNDQHEVDLSQTSPLPRAAMWMGLNQFDGGFMKPRQ